MQECNVTISFSKITKATAAFVFVLLTSISASHAAEADGEDDGGDEFLKGSTTYKLVSVQNGEPIAQKIYWRRYQGTIAAQTTPVRFLIDEAELIAPRKIVDKTTREIRTLYPSSTRKDIANGKHTLFPGEIPINMDGGKITSPHPAIKVSGSDVNILCAPVRFEAIDTRGVPNPLSVKVTCGKEPLLREVANFDPLIIWLPVGLKYTSTLGAFSIAPDGKINADGQLAKNVKLSDVGLTLSVESSEPEMLRGENARVIDHVPGEGKKAIKCYIEPLIKPGDAARIALSKTQFEAASKAKFTATSFSFTIHSFANGNILYPLATSRYEENLAPAPPEALAQAAARELKTELADLVWFNLPAPKAITLGPIYYSLTETNFGTLRGLFIVGDPLAPLQILPHRQRAVFSDNEEASFAVLVKAGFAGGEAKIMCRATADGAKPVELGKVTLPKTTDRYDSRMFTLRTREIPAGNHELWIEAAAASSPHAPLSVIPWQRKSSFLVHSMAGCGGMWSIEDAGMKVLQDAGLEMVCAGGFTSPYTTELPAIDPHATEWLMREHSLLPAEAAYRTTFGDDLAQRFLGHQIRHIDFYPRAQNFYLEGLSYHHSYKPSVDRMIRHMQVFTQQSADYPSFWGMNYSWFPALFGYAESGIDTDIHKINRNAELAENLKKAGFIPLSADERKFYEENKFSGDADKRAKALQLMQRAVAHWKAQMNFGFGKHNKLYNDSVRQIRPDAVCVLYENAGHDECKRTRELFGDMDAATYESYSDYPEWPMSASFTTEWGRGNFRNKPLWITTDGGTSSEGMMKSLLHAFGRGAGGAGVLMPSDDTVQELNRRAKGLHFVGQYGAIATHAVPDHRVAILSTAAEQILNPDGRTQYGYHAMYYHLTRLGFPAIIVDDEDAVASGIPDGVKALFVVRQRQPLEPKVAEVVDAFVKKGGKLFITGDSQVKIDGAIVIDKPIKHIWNGSGFKPESHKEMWEQFEEVWRKPLTDALASVGLSPAANVDPDHGIAICLDAGPIRYAVVMADEKNEPPWTFRPAPDLPVSLEGTGWQVRDLAKQQMLKSSEKDGRTVLSVELATEPATILALYKTAPAHVDVKTRGTAKLGADLAFTCEVSAAKGGPSIGALPIKYELVDAAGKVRNTLFRAAGEEVRIPLPSLDQPGTWKLSAQELVTGVTATVDLNLGAVPPPQVVAQVADVHVVSDRLTYEFFKHAGEKRVVIESSQERLLPVAKKLVDELTAAGVKARIWQIKPEDFDTIPVRWYPRTDEDLPRLKDVEAGNLIGWRENMKPFIDTLKRAHVPERGGYGEIDPLLMVGSDVIVFSGGELANGLRSVTPWMGTPNIPGKAQGRLVAVFSPFCADRHALAVVANDDDGLAKAAARVSSFATPPKTAEPAAPEAWASQTAKGETKNVATPFVGYTPIRRVAKLLASHDGKAVVYLEGKKDTRAFVDASGKVTATVTAETSDLPHAMIDNEGRSWEFTSKHLGGEWYMQEITLRCIGTDGALQNEIQSIKGSVYFDTLPTDWQGAFPISPDGASAALGLRGGMLVGKLGDPQWRHYDDIPNVHVRDAIRHPRFPVGASFSPDGHYILMTMDTRPPGWGGMNGPAEHPSACETMLLDVATGKPVWRLSDTKNIRKTTYAIHSGFGAVSKDGALSAFADYLGFIYLVDKTGKIVAQEQIASQLPARYTAGPVDGIGVWMNDSGTLAAFGYKNLLLLSQGKTFARVPVSMLVSGCVTGDGSLAVIATESGEVKAFDPMGAPKWTVSPGGIAPRVAASGANQILVGTSAGELVLLDVAGKEVRRVNVAEAADREKHELKPGAQFQKVARPHEYTEPGTLELAQKNLGAKQIAAWKPAGQGNASFGKTFYAVDAPIVLNVPADSKEKEFILHVVYRNTSDKALTVQLDSKEGAETFVLDLPTPEYRVVDLPLRGVGAKATLSGQGEVAEFSLSSFRWPGANIAFVQSAKSAALEGPKETSGGVDDLLGEIDGESGLSGKMKQCKIIVPNPDIDKIQGQNLKPDVDPLQMVDGKRFGNGKIPSWTKKPFIGNWFTIDFGKAVPIKLVATYDRVQKQSELSVNIAVFSAAGQNENVKAGVVQNDQFWRIFALNGEKIQTLGVHVYSGLNDGLSEIEAYSAPAK